MYDFSYDLYQICMGIAMFTAMKTKKNVLYIDTGGSLSATRIKDMLQEWNTSLDDQVWTTQNVTVF